MYIYNTRGTCARQIILEIDGEKDTILSTRFIGGCSGNLQGIAKLIDGQKVDDVIEKLNGIQCRNNTSCPDQLAKALMQYKSEIVN